MKKLIDIARGIIKADLVLKNAQIVNVYTGTIEFNDIAINDGIIAGIGNYDGENNIDLDGKIVLPGLIDSHIHIESSMLIPSKFSDAVLPYGITTVIADPHEIANVSGVSGIKFMIEDSRNSPLDALFMLPSCVPATSFETSGAVIDSTISKKLISDNDILGLGEMMNYPGVIYKDEEVLSKINAAHMEGKIIDGHAPMLKGKDLNAYVAAGIKTDHEASTYEEAEEKIKRGMYILVREGTAAKNLKELIGLARTDAYRRLLLCSDDCHPYDLLNYGTINNSIKLAIAYGVSPIRAIQMSTINASECYHLVDRGAIAPGLIADIVVVNNLEELNVLEVYKRGKLVARSGKIIKASDSQSVNFKCFNCFPIKSEQIKLSINSNKVNVIGLIENSILTNHLVLKASSIGKGVLKICVVERHKDTGNISVGLVKGYNIRNGAVATSIAHDSHNIIAIGDNDIDIINAVNEIIRVGGGITVSSNNVILGTLELPISGLMTNKSVIEVNEIYEKLVKIVREMGVAEGIHPFMTLSFLALPVIPHLKITDKGLFDVDKFEFTTVEIN